VFRAPPIDGRCDRDHRQAVNFLLPDRTMLANAGHSAHPLDQGNDNVVGSGSWWKIFGLVAGSLSLISLAQKIWHVGLLPIPAAIIGYYRDMLVPIHNIVSSFVPFTIPDWYEDLWILSALYFSMWARAFDYSLGHKGYKYGRDNFGVGPIRYFLMAILAIILAIFMISTMIPLVTYIITLLIWITFVPLYVAFTWELPTKKTGLTGNAAWIVSSFTMIAVAIAFFSWNASIR
jgi:hypothetical protein